MSATPFDQIPLFSLLATESQAFLRAQAENTRFSHQEARQLAEIALDFQMWDTEAISQQWKATSSPLNKEEKKAALSALRAAWEAEKTAENRYSTMSNAPKISAAAEPVAVEKAKLGLGNCPVASPKTRCCNLQTLDAVDNCGYGCSYCSIQSFFDGKQIRFDKGFAEKLAALKLDPRKTYHIGTGQSSDSLMWGNSHGVLDTLIDFARENPNVILELKTKSANVSHLIRSVAPKNMLLTWSLNTPTIIAHEEHGTMALEKRIAAARKAADAGFVVGFHFHPMVHYAGWDEDYPKITETLVDTFETHEVALISLGTLTYIKAVMKDIRQRAIPSQILKMPLVDADGKLSYPDDIKLELFSTLYNAFPQSWKDDVFFYLCMENQRFWQPVFGFEYASNDKFEAEMKAAYLKKISAHTKLANHLKRSRQPLPDHAPAP